MKEFVCDDDYKPLLPDGIYEAQCVKCNEKFVMGKTLKVFLNFKIIDIFQNYGFFWLFETKKNRVNE